MADNKDNEERRNEFMDTAEKLFKENGIVDTTINSIVKELDVAKGLFYYYFKSKDDVIDAISDKYNTLFKEMISTSMDHPKYEERLQQYMQNCIHSFHTLNNQLKGKENADLSPLISRSLTEAKKAMEKGMCKLLEEGNRTDYFSLEHPDYYAKILTGGIISLVSEDADEKEIEGIMNDLLTRLKKEKNNV